MVGPCGGIGLQQTQASRNLRAKTAPFFSDVGVLTQSQSNSRTATSKAASSTTSKKMNGAARNEVMDFVKNRQISSNFFRKN